MTNNLAIFSEINHHGAKIREERSNERARFQSLIPELARLTIPVNTGCDGLYAALQHIAQTILEFTRE